MLRNWKWSCVFLDFDGVILESAEAKTRAFQRVFGHSPELVREIQRQNEDAPRREKLSRMYLAVNARSPSATLLNRLEQEFGEICKAELARCILVPGTVELLTEFSPLLPFYVASAAPAAEVRREVERLGLLAFFCKVFGAPPAKAETLVGALREIGISPSRAVFVGDTEADAAAARRSGIWFIARNTGSGSIRSSEGLPLAADLFEVADILRLHLRR